MSKCTKKMFMIIGIFGFLALIATGLFIFLRRCDCDCDCDFEDDFDDDFDDDENDFEDDFDEDEDSSEREYVSLGQSSTNADVSDSTPDTDVSGASEDKDTENK